MIVIASLNLVLDFDFAVLSGLKMREEKIEKTKLNLLISLLKKENEVYIQTHDFPDPDAVAAAFGLQYLLKEHGVPSKIVYEGLLQSNPLKRMISELDISLFHNADINLTKESKIIIVDGCKGNENVTDLIGSEIAIIDHHQDSQDRAVLFSDIKSDYGSCSTIISLYYKEAGINLPENVATALAIGIYVDTNYFLRGVSAKDLEAFYFLFKKIKHSVVGSILRNNIFREELTFYKEAIDNIVIFNRFAFYCFTKDCSQNILGMLADFFLSIEEVDFVVLCARKKETIIISVRNERLECDASLITQEAVKGIGKSGGHKEMAGAIIKDISLFDKELLYKKFVELLNTKRRFP